MEIIAFWRQNAQYLRVMTVTPEALAHGIKPAAFSRLTDGDDLPINSAFRFFFQSTPRPAAIFFTRLAVGLIFFTQGVLKFTDPALGVNRFTRQNAALEGFNPWTINAAACPMTEVLGPAAFHLNQGKRYRLRMRNASDDTHPIHHGAV